MLIDSPPRPRPAVRRYVLDEPTSPQHVCAALWEVQPAREQSLMEAPLYPALGTHVCPWHSGATGDTDVPGALPET